MRDTQYSEAVGEAGAVVRSEAQESFRPLKSRGSRVAS